MRNRYPLNGHARLARVAAKGGGRGGRPPTHQRAPTSHSQGPGWGDPDMAARAPRARPGARGGGGSPHPAVCTTRAQAGARGGHPEQNAHNHCAHPEGGGGGGTPQTAVCTPHAWHEGEGGGEPLDQEDNKGESPEQHEPQHMT